MAILVVRYLWKRRCLPLYYYGGAEASCAFLAQYLVRLTFDRKPSGHHKVCQVCAEVWYEKDEAFIIPLNLTKVPWSQVLFLNLIWSFKLAAGSLEAEANLTGARPHEPAPIERSYGHAQAQVCTFL